MDSQGLQFWYCEQVSLPPPRSNYIFPQPLSYRQSAAIDPCSYPREGLLHLEDRKACRLYVTQMREPIS